MCTLLYAITRNFMGIMLYKEFTHHFARFISIDTLIITILVSTAQSRHKEKDTKSPIPPICLAIVLTIATIGSFKYLTDVYENIPVPIKTYTSVRLNETTNDTVSVDITYDNDTITVDAQVIYDKSQQQYVETNIELSANKATSSQELQKIANKFVKDKGLCYCYPQVTVHIPNKGI